MGLFNINFRRSYDEVVSRHLDLENIIRRRSHSIRGRSSVVIHIGEAEPFSIDVENFAACKVLSKTEYSICLQIMYTNGNDDEILVAKWSSVKTDITSRDHVAVLIACDVIETPRYRLKEVFRHYNKFISIGIRTYVRGHTLRSVYDSLSEEEIDAIFIQVQAIMWLLAKKTSKHFGHINDGVFRTSSPIAYIRTKVFFDKALGILNEADWIEQGSDSYISDAIFCHGNISPEHIILDGTTVVGVVGWTNADFMPEAYERLSYYFRSDPKDPRCWFRRMADVTTCPETGRPSVEFIFNVTLYTYKRAWNIATASQKHVINQLWRALTTNYTQLNCLSLATEIDCDNMSLDSLTSWSNFTTSTVKPD